MTTRSEKHDAIKNLLKSDNVKEKDKNLIREALEKGRIDLIYEVMQDHLKDECDKEKIERQIIRCGMLLPTVPPTMKKMLQVADDSADEDRTFVIEEFTKRFDLVKEVETVLKGVARSNLESNVRAHTALQSKDNILDEFEAICSVLSQETISSILQKPLVWEDVLESPVHHQLEDTEKSLIFLHYKIVNSLFVTIDSDFVTTRYLRRYIIFLMRFSIKHGGMLQCSYRSNPESLPKALLFNLGQRDKRTGNYIFGLCIRNDMPGMQPYVFKYISSHHLSYKDSRLLSGFELPPIPPKLFPKPINFMKLALKDDPSLATYSFDNSLYITYNYQHISNRRKRCKGITCDNIKSAVEFSFWIVRCRPHLATPQWNVSSNSLQLLLPLFIPETNIYPNNVKEPVGALIASLSINDSDHSSQYVVNTILNLEDAFNNSKLVTHTPPRWLLHNVKHYVDKCETTHSPSSVDETSSSHSSKK
jgi:hypothetical protein